MNIEIFIPGLPIKRNNPCIDPQQSQIPHAIMTYEIMGDELIRKGYEPNTENYPEYSYIIQMFIDNVVNKKEREVMA